MNYTGWCQNDFSVHAQALPMREQCALLDLVKFLAGVVTAGTNPIATLENSR